MTALIAREQTATGLSWLAAQEISETLKQLLADVSALYVKTKGFHWHVNGRHFRDDHLLLDEHAEQIFAMTDDIAERDRKIGGFTLRSIGDISRHQRIKDSENGNLPPRQMFSELRDDNAQLTRYLGSAHEVCAKHNDVATTSLIEVWIDQTERRHDRNSLRRLANRGRNIAQHAQTRRSDIDGAAIVAGDPTSINQFTQKETRK